MTNSEVIVIGSCNVDLISYVERFPKAGETICGSKFQTGCGGKGANQCVAAAKLGAKTVMVGCVGSDNFGKTFIEAFQNLSIDIDHLHVIENISTGVASIVVNDQGENNIVIVKGANDCLSLEHINHVIPRISSSTVVLFQLENDLDVTRNALKLARHAGATTIFNPAPAVEGLSEEFLRNTSILCCNETEAAILTDMKVDTKDDYATVLKTLLSKGPEIVVLTLGADGAIYACKENEEIYHIKPDQQNIKVVDTTGAGDCFVGSLAYFIAMRKDLSFKEAMRRAVAIASISVCKEGTQTSYPFLNELPTDLTE